VAEMIEPGRRGAPTRQRRRWRFPLVAVVVAMALVAASCGDDDDDGASPGSTTGTSGTSGAGTSAAGPSSSAADAADDDVDPEGVLRWTLNLEGPTVGHFDPTKLLVQAQNWALFLVYDSLLRGEADGELEPALAEEARVIDPRTIEVDLRPGLVFSDGTPLDAEAVKFTIERNKATQPGSNGFRAEIRNVESVEVRDATHLVIHLDAPVAGAFYPLLGGIETMPVSPAAASADLDTRPVGAGAFTLTEFTAGNRAVFAKSPTYWDADGIRLAGVEVRHLPAGPAVLNALRTGEIDVATVPITDAAALRAELEVQVEKNPTSHMWLRWCVAAEPIDDVRVRQALSYGTDREALSEAIAGGDGEPQWALWPSDHDLFPAELEGRHAHDPARARQLLAEAGHPDGFAIEMLISPDPFQTRIAEIIQAQWAEIGVQLRITPTTNYVQELFTDRKAPIGLAAVDRPGIEKLSAFYVPGLFSNLCNYESPEMTNLIQQLRAAAPGSDEARRLWAEGQEMVIEQGLSLYLFYLPVALAHDDERVGDMEIFVNWQSAMPDVWKAYIKR